MKADLNTKQGMAELLETVPEMRDGVTHAL